jgi:4-amino-4-deoxy-L-arabinose transferase-like glycosyltransferase
MSAPDANSAMADGSSAPRKSDLLWLLLMLAVLVATGVGTRAPWPADEPRFALIARDMVATGDWLIPRVGGNLYQEKPPFFFWVLSAFYALTGSVKASFLLPSLLAAGTVLGLVYDLARRLWSREAALAAAGTLAFTVQFVLTARSAQIDATLCALTTLSLYGLLRHLLLGPAWWWYFVGGLAAGLGVITKGVGFLPLLVLIPYGVFRARGFEGLPRFQGDVKWAGAAVGFLLGVAVWLVPMLTRVAGSNDPELKAYRDGILFQQTVERYASAWHHVKPWYYFLVEVIPPLWLPFSVLLIWLVPKWRQAWRARDARVWLPLAWVLLAILFFSLSSGKRGIYIFPALPAALLAAAPFLPDLFRSKGIKRASLVLALALVIPALALAIGLLADMEAAERAVSKIGLTSHTPIVAFAFVATALWIAAWLRRPLLAWPAVLACLAVVWSYGITPLIDSDRSGRRFIESVMAQVPAGKELAFVGYKEQFFLYAARPTVSFGHRRWVEGPQEAYDAAAWIAESPGRTVLIEANTAKECFSRSPQREAGNTSGDRWLLVEAPADSACEARGYAGRARRYVPPK